MKQNYITEIVKDKFYIVFRGDLLLFMIVIGFSKMTHFDSTKKWDDAQYFKMLI